ncbi:MAG: NAD(P)H-dependent glycerol-3-phosphate dehydrogenase [Alphaproteobacteria bacterium]|tara:strand:+ start:1162 stop:2142 length:981 start_codon:yes stop_codon:yes gene_type:complete
MKIGIIGGGVWGSAIAKLLSNNKVCIITRDTKIVTSINEHRFNPRLKYAVFNENVSATADLNEAKDMDYLFLTLPSQKIRDVLSKVDLSKNTQEIIIASKGIEIESCSFLSDVVKEVSKNTNINILSGPCFSEEVSQNLPTAVTFASSNKKSFENINSLFHNKNFRIYYSDDLIGCQIGGALKNIYAIAAGITLGLNLGENAKSALITRSFVEISRFGESMGAKKQTIFGLSGLGDLILTCSSLKSRNTKFGQLISSTNNPDIDDILKSQQITEGYYTVKAVKNIADDKKIEMPIMNAIYNILYNQYNIKDVINNLLERPIKDEIK